MQQQVEKESLGGNDTIFPSCESNSDNHREATTYAEFDDDAVHSISLE